MGYKQVILIRNDLKMPKGKLAVQVAHASVTASLKCKAEILKAWQSKGMKKIVLKVVDKEDLLYYMKKARNAKFTTALVTDAGKTFFDTHTTTCCAIGPALEEKLDTITGDLKMV